MTDETRTKPSWRRPSRMWRDARGNVGVIFALLAVALVTFIGAGLDLSRAYVVRQELSNVATLGCQYSTRPLVYEVAYSNNNGLTAYQNQVNSFIAQSLTGQNFPQTELTGQSTTTPFTYTALGSNGQVALTAIVPTLFLPIMGINSLSMNVTVSCAAGQAENTSPAGTVVLSESFENSACAGTCWSTFQPNGTRQNPSPNTQNTFTTTIGYVGASGAEWSIMGYCLEIDGTGVIRSTSADGTHAAELDCDNGSGTAGASSISNKTYYTKGTYELRYSFAGRVAYPDYDPTYICGSTAGDVSWANDTNASIGGFNNVLRNNQVGVYLDADQNDSAPTHVTLAGVTLAGSNLVDVCVTSTGWIQRSVKFTVTTAGYYWLSFAADGQNDSYGADIDAIEVCVTACSGSVQDNFPSAWTSTPLMFEDSFASPVASGSTVNTSQVLDSDYGASNAAWPNEASHGWATGPYDQVGIVRASAMVDAGSQSLELDSYKGSGQSTSRRSVSQYFYLDPGYYAITYDYISAVKFNSVTGTNCTYTPSTSTALSSYSTTTSTSGKNQITNASGNWPKDTNAVAVFMSHSLEVSYPNGGGGLNTTTGYTNPSGSITTTPTVAPDSVSTSSYNAAQLNPVLDYCNYSSAWTTRTTYARITKAAQYWLTIGAEGASASQDGVGGVIDDVKVTAIGSLYGTSPSFFATIPTPTPANGSSVSFTGFTVVADPLTP